MTLNCCKPDIRKAAALGDWVVGLGSTSVDMGGNRVSFKGRLIFAMKVEQIMHMSDYDAYCKSDSLLINKIPSDLSWRHKLGDCIYDFSRDRNNPIIKRNAMHKKKDQGTDLSGVNTLLSENFYYFGSCRDNVQNIVKNSDLIHQYIGHKVIEDQIIIKQFESWLMQLNKFTNFPNNESIPWPQLKSKIDDSYYGNGNYACD
jgi:hypothetical protein